jgi:hypothetical protein
MTPGLASLAAALVATQPSGAARSFVETLCASTKPAARRNAIVVLGESALFSLRDARGSRAGSEPRDDDCSFADALLTLAGRISESSEKDVSVRDAARDAIRRAPLSRTVATVSALFDSLETKAETKKSVSDDALEAVLLAALRGRGAVVATRALLEALRDERNVLFPRNAEARMGPGVARAIETFGAWFRENAARESLDDTSNGFDAASLLETGARRRRRGA